MSQPASGLVQISGIRDQLAAHQLGGARSADKGTVKGVNATWTLWEVRQNAFINFSWSGSSYPESTPALVPKSLETYSPRRNPTTDPKTLNPKP